MFYLASGHSPRNQTARLAYTVAVVSQAIPTFEPTEITIGETLKWRKTLADYEASDGWELAYYFRGPASGAGQGLDIGGSPLVVADGDSWLVTIPATSSGVDPSTSNLSAGDYYWQAWVTKADEEYKVGEGKAAVKPNLFDLGTAVAYDGRSWVKQTLDAIRAAMAKRATAAQLRRSIGNTSIEFMSMTELIVAETRFAQLYNQESQKERLQKGGPFLQNVNIRFGGIR